MRRFAGIVTAGAALLLGLLSVSLLGAAPAQAHAQLIGTAPGDQQTVTSAPSSVALEFNGDVISLGLQFQVIGPAGLATKGRAVVNRGTVTQPLASPLVNGKYVVNWHVVHDDGHPDAGTFSFAIDAPAGATRTAATTLAAGGSPTASRPVFQPVAASTQGIPPFWVSLGVLIVVVLVVVAVVIDRRRRHPVP